MCKKNLIRWIFILSFQHGVLSILKNNYKYLLKNTHLRHTLNVLKDKLIENAFKNVQISKIMQNETLNALWINALKIFICCLAWMVKIRLHIIMTLSKLSRISMTILCMYCAIFYTIEGWNVPFKHININIYKAIQHAMSCFAFLTQWLK